MKVDERDLDVLGAWLDEDPGRRMVTVTAAAVMFAGSATSSLAMWALLAEAAEKPSPDGEPFNVRISKHVL